MTTNNEAFDKWAKDHEYAIDDYVYALEIWQSATTEANKRIAELESDNKIYAECNAELKEKYEANTAILQGRTQRMNELLKSNNHLRDALESIAETNASKHGTSSMMIERCINIANEALKQK